MSAAAPCYVAFALVLGDLQVREPLHRPYAFVLPRTGNGLTVLHNESHLIFTPSRTDYDIPFLLFGVALPRDFA